MNSERAIKPIAAMKLSFLAIVFLIIATPFAYTVWAQEASFRTLELAFGIWLDVPSHWTELPIESRKNLRAAGEAMLENSGVEGDTGKKEPLLAMNAVPAPHGAMIRLSVTTPASFSQSDLEAVTAFELKELEAEMVSMISQMEASGGFQLIEMQPITVERINGHRALVMAYVRAGINGPSPWQVRQYKIPVSGRLIEFTLSHRQSGAIVWEPILEKVKRSIEF